MKKLFAMTLLVLASAITITSCTEEAVNPKAQENSNAGGGDSGGNP